MKAKDLMQPLTEHLSPGDSLKAAATRLGTACRGEENVGLSALPVVDVSGRLVGILSIGDFLKAVYPPYLYLVDLGEFAWDGMVEAIAKKAAERSVREIMTGNVVTVMDDSTLMQCVDHMLKHNFEQVPVLDKNEKVIGMLSKQNIFYAITKAMLEKTEGGTYDS